MIIFQISIKFNFKLIIKISYIKSYYLNDRFKKMYYKNEYNKDNQSSKVTMWFKKGWQKVIKNVSWIAEVCFQRFCVIWIRRKTQNLKKENTERSQIGIPCTNLGSAVNPNVPFISFDPSLKRENFARWNPFEVWIYISVYFLHPH